MKYWTTSELRHLRANTHKTNNELAKDLNRTVSSVDGALIRFGIRKDSSGRFTKGHVPFNKGAKYDAGGRSHRTRFKPGGEPPNTRKDFDISVRKDKSGVSYKHIRIAKAKWIPLHRYVWSLQRGDIPRGMIIRFKDGDTLNCDIDNLEMITRREHLMRNHNRDKQAASMIKRWRYKKTLKDYGL